MEKSRDGVPDARRKHLHDARKQTLGARAHVHGLDGQPQRVNLNQWHCHHRSHSRNQVAHSSTAWVGQWMLIVVEPRRSSMRMSPGDTGVA